MMTRDAAAKLQPPLEELAALRREHVAQVPVAWDDRVLVTLRSGQLVCCQVPSGTEAWRFALGQPVKAGSWDGQCLLHGAHVVVARDEDLVVLERDGGGEVARIDVPGIDLRTAILVGDVLVARGFDAESDVAAIELREPARLRWRRAAPAYAGRVAVVGDKVIYTDWDAVAAVELSTGAPAWSFAVADGGEVRGSPLAWRDQVLVGLRSRRVIALDGASGALRWTADVDAHEPASLCAADGQLLCLGAALDVIDAGSGQARGRFPLRTSSPEPRLAGVFTPPVASSTHVFAGDKRAGLIAVARADGTVERIGDGVPLNLGDAPLLHGGRLYALDGQGTLHVYHPAPRP